MTKEEIAVLDHAFFDGKVLQMWFKGDWKDWPFQHRPKFTGGEKWRIKPDEPKTITICTLYSSIGRVMLVVKDTNEYNSGLKCGWTHIKSLDQVFWRGRNDSLTNMAAKPQSATDSSSH